ncbi:MAG: radical SAM protein [Candidatus Hydrogenedentes bacterium]|nr:radical SAM protein [Candidatus Hydrogenedentota bacterium]
MEILRKIGRFELLVDSSEACGISLEEAAVAHLGTAERSTLSKREILNILARDDEYYPLTLRWELLDFCNFSCPFCYIVGHSFNKAVRFSEIQTHIEDLIDAGLLFCTLTGGEVTQHPDFHALYRFLKEHGVIVEVFTNGLAITDELIQLFRTYPPVAVEVSLYSLNSEKLHEVYRVRGQQPAETILNNVLLMDRAGVNVVCKTFVNTVTQGDVDDIARWCAERGIKHYTSSEITQAYDGTNLSQFALTTPHLSRAEPKSVICMSCGTKNYGSAINSAFQIFPCPAINLKDCTFDVRQLGVDESLRRIKSFMRRFQDTEIRRSKSGSGCATCIAYAKPKRNEAGEIIYFEHA